MSASWKAQAAVPKGCPLLLGLKCYCNRSVDKNKAFSDKDSFKYPGIFFLYHSSYIDMLNLFSSKCHSNSKLCCYHVPSQNGCTFRILQTVFANENFAKDFVFAWIWRRVPGIDFVVTEFNFPYSLFHGIVINSILQRTEQMLR